MRKYFVIGAILIMMVLGTAVVSAQTDTEIRIDDFANGNQSITLFSPGTQSSSVQADTGLGLRRKLIAEVTSGNFLFTGANVTGETFQVVAGDPTQYVVTVVWDGDSDGAADTIDYTGLNGVDLTRISGDQVADGILLSIVGWDGNPLDIRVTVYTDASSYSVATYRVRGDDPIGPYNVSLCFYEGCFQQGDGAGGEADFEDVGAIVMEIVSIESGADITIDLTFASAARDFGDLPDSYNTLEPDPVNPLTGGARHSQGNVRLGAGVDTELDANIVGNDASGDSFDDGITVVGTDGTRWQDGENGGAVQVNWVSPEAGGFACLDGWIDWEQSGNFTDIADKVVSGYRLSGTSPYQETVLFDVPDGTFPGGIGDPFNLASRWRIYPVDPTTRLCPSAGIEYFGYIINGEVEDYIWGFTPTAVSLQSTGASTSSSTLLGLVAIFALTLVSAGALIYRRQTRVQ